jgi:hypothetical protein
MTDNTDPFSIDDLLGPGGRPAPDLLRQEVLARTTQVMRRRRWWRRASVGTALAACYLAGVLTARLGGPGPAPVAVPEAAKGEAGLLDRPAKPAGDQVPDEPRMASSAVDLEWQALDSREDRPDLYRLAGERYEQAGDVASALRCYQQSLSQGDTEKLTVSENDNWLLIALKEARQKEQHRAN